MSNAKEPWLDSLKVGDTVRRKPEHRVYNWVYDAEPMLVKEIHNDGTLALGGCGDARWQHYKFYPFQAHPDVRRTSE